MTEKINMNELSNEHRNLIIKIEKNKNKAFKLPLLCMLLMIIEMLITMFLNVDMKIAMFCTCAFSIIINAYVLYKLNECKGMLSFVISADINHMTIDELYKNKDKKDIKFAKVSWKSFMLEYIMVIVSCYFTSVIPVFAIVS